MRSNKTFGHYFLNNRLLPKTPLGYRPDVLLIIRRAGKILLLKQANSFWSIPKEGIKGESLVDDLINTVTHNLIQELGFIGPEVLKLNPKFELQYVLFNFATQKYDLVRSKEEKAKNRPDKGKIYHLIVIDYYGPSELPISHYDSKEILDFTWKNEAEGLKLLRSNLDLLSQGKINSINTVNFNINLWNKVNEDVNTIDRSRNHLSDTGQLRLE